MSQTGEITFMNDNAKEVPPEEVSTKSDFTEPEILVGDIPAITAAPSPGSDDAI